MAEVQETRRKLQIATATLVVLNVALAAVFFSPIVGSQRSRKEELNRLWKDPEPVGLRPVEIEADFAGDYLQLVRFINSLERAPLFFIINSIELGGEQAGVVRLQLKLQTYLRASA